MNLYIQLDDNKQPINHPCFEDNILQCYPDIDLTTTNLFAPFIRLPQPSLEELPRTHFQVLESQYIYNIFAKAYTDSYYVRDMSVQEQDELTSLQILNINNNLQIFREEAIRELSIATLPSEQIIWQNYLIELDNYTYTDPFNTIVPVFPKRDSTGKLFSISSSGSAPNVIE